MTLAKNRLNRERYYFETDRDILFQKWMRQFYNQSPNYFFCESGAKKNINHM